MTVSGLQAYGTWTAMGRMSWERLPFPRLRINDPKREIDRAGRVVDPCIDRLDLGLETLARGPGVVVMLFQSFVVHNPFKKKPGAERPYGIAAIAAGSDGRAAPGAGSGPYSQR